MSKSTQVPLGDVDEIVVAMVSKAPPPVHLGKWVFAGKLVFTDDVRKIPYGTDVAFFEKKLEELSCVGVYFGEAGKFTFRNVTSVTRPDHARPSGSITDVTGELFVISP